MPDYRVKVTVRNARLLRAIEAAGYSSLSKLARDEGISYPCLVNLVGMKSAPIGKSGEFTKVAKTLMEILGAAPCELWSEPQLYAELDRNTVERDISEVEAARLTSTDPAEIAERDDEVQALLSSLRSRDGGVLRMRYLEDKGLVDIGDSMDCSRERVRQIEMRALRNLRDRAKKLDMNP